MILITLIKKSVVSSTSVSSKPFQQSSEGWFLRNKRKNHFCFKRYMTSWVLDAGKGISPCFKRFSLRYCTWRVYSYTIDHKEKRFTSERLITVPFMIDSPTPVSPGFIVRREKVDEMCSNSKGFITGLLQRIPWQLHDEPYFNRCHLFPEHFNGIHQPIYSTSSLIH